MPNVVMIALDDVNAWATLKSTYGGTVHTPNLDRLAATGLSFTEAHTPVPLCNPARTAVLSGMSPLQSGVVNNIQAMFDTIAPNQTLPALLNAAGWQTATAGKVFHSLSPDQAAGLYDTVLSFGRRDEDQDLNERNFIPTTSTVPSGYWIGDPEALADARTVASAEAFLAAHVPQPGAAGLFLSVGLINTHAPWVVPKEYFDLYPLDQIVLPESPAGDLDDVPGFALQFTDPLEIDRILAAGDWQARVQAYLATVSYMDAMVGRLLDALEASSIADDTMVVLWSDHGFHLGEKDSLGKNSLWAQSTRAPLIIADPSGDRAGEVEDRVVSMIDILPTIMEYAGRAAPNWADGHSLLDLVRTGSTAGLPGLAVSMVDGSFSVRTDQYRYTRYEDGSEELYDVVADPREYENLAADAAHAAEKAAIAGTLESWLDQFNLVQNLTATPQRLVGTHRPDILIAGFGRDTLVGGRGDDTFLLRDVDQRVVETALGGRDAVIIGGEWTDYQMPLHIEELLIGRAGALAPATTLRRIVGNDLDNRIRLGEAKDLVVAAGAGDDVVIGGRRTNILHGQDGNDLLTGGGGRGLLDGGAGNDRLSGGEGNDTYIASQGQDYALDDGAGGLDAVDVTAWGVAETVLQETRTASGALSSVRFVHRETGDSLSFRASSVENPIEALIDDGAFHLLKPLTFQGRAVQDLVFGSRGRDTLLGAAGDDLLSGADGYDSIAGGQGSDTISGQDGNDQLVLGAAQRDMAFGGAGNDRFSVATGVGLLDGGEGYDSLVLTGNGRSLSITGIERIDLAPGASLDATVLLDPTVALVLGQSADAAIRITGATVIDAEAVRLVSVRVVGDAQANTGLFGIGNYTVLANAGDDFVSGAAGNQTLDGGAGADTLQGNAGHDLLRAGTDAESDLFVFRGGAGDGRDTVAGFVPDGAEPDRVEIHGIGGPGQSMSGLDAAAAGFLRAAATADGAQVFYRADITVPFDASMLFTGLTTAQGLEAVTVLGG